MASRILLNSVLPFGRRLNFYTRAAVPNQVAASRIEDVTRAVETGFSGAENAFVRACLRTDADASPRDASGTAVFRLRTYLVKGVEILGHTGAAAIPERRAIIWTAPGPPSWNLSKPRRLRPVEPLRGRAAAMSGTDNYFHFLMNDVLPLLDYLERLHPDGMPLTAIVPRKPPSFTFEVMDTLKAEFPSLRTRRIGMGQKIAVDEFVALERRTENREWFLWDDGPARRLKELVFAHRSRSAGDRPASRLFVTRGASRIRRLVNEDEMMTIAEARGFEVFTPRADNFTEQLARFDAARHVVAVHGAALTNLLWCRPEAQVLELFPGNFLKSTYLWLAKRLKLGHHALPCGDGDDLLAFRADPDAFARALDRMIAVEERGAA